MNEQRQFKMAMTKLGKFVNSSKAKLPRYGVERLGPRMYRAWTESPNGRQYWRINETPIKAVNTYIKAYQK